MTAGSPPVAAVGDGAVLRLLPGPAEARGLARAARAGAPAAVHDVVAGLRSVLVEFDPRSATTAEVAGWLAGVGPGPSDDGEPATLVVEAAFDGPDLDEVAAQAGLDRPAVGPLLASAQLEVAVLGFSPGFAYLDGLPEPLARVGRRPAPRPRVPAGSVALAGGFAAVYPQATPGGWQLVGRTGLPLFDPRRPPFARLRPGDRVRFVVSTAEPAALPEPERAPRRVLGPGPLAATVEAAGPLDLLQDLGRLGVAHLGVPRAGAADPDAHRLADALVGNRPEAPTVEVTGSGLALRWRHQGLVAVVGARAALTVDGRPAPVGHVVPVAAGQRVAVGATARAYLAVRGGFGSDPVMGSAATDVLSWTGPGRLAAGDELGLGQPVGRPAGHLVPGAPGTPGAEGWPTGPPGSGHPVVLRVLPGPHLDRFPPGALERLAAGAYAVDPDSDRVGLRLRPAGPPVPAARGELDSQPMVTGAVQVPPGGRPIVLLPDHATLGGYPVAAVVITADRGRLGRLAPGDAVHLEVVTADEASAALAGLERGLAAGVVGRFPVATA